jgi:hypothetical protein
VLARFDKQDCPIEVASFNPFLYGKPVAGARVFQV